MRFGAVHRTMTNALAVLGIFALVLSGQISHAMTALIVVALAAAIGVPLLRDVEEEAWHASPWVQRLATFAPVALLSVELLRWFFGRSALEIAIEFAALLQVIRLVTRRGAAHDQQVIILALLHLIAGTVLGGNIGYALCFLGFVVVAPSALVLSHLRREVEGNYRQGARDRTGLPVDVPRILRSRRVVGKRFLLVTSSLSVPILLFTTALFLLFPRVVRPFLSLTRSSGARTVGFDDRVDLGSHGAIRDDPQIALRVAIPNLAASAAPPERVALYLRGAALDHYDGRAWTRTLTHRHPVASLQQVVPVERWPDPRDQVMIVDREPFEPSVIPLPLGTVAFELIPRGEPSFLSAFAQVRVERGPEGEYRFRNADDLGIRYRVSVAPEARQAGPALPREDVARYLALPPLPERVAKLAATWAAEGSSDLEKARAIERHLRSEYRYDLASPSGGAPQPLDHFLFESRRGHCEFYSTAMAVMLRTAQIPSRNVTGFVGGTWNRFSQTYTVRQGDAHAWVEAFIDGRWMTFDPTPPAEALPKSQLRGFLATLRDIAEATTQRWDRWVVGYDIHEQVTLYEQLRRALRGDGTSSFFGGMSSWKLLGLGLGLTGAGWLVARYLRRQQKVASPRRPARPTGHRARDAAAATALYEQLDAAMIAQGIGRPEGIPPLLHASRAPVAEHPLAAEIQALTEAYLAARFGARALDEDERARFARRVRSIRGYRAKRP